MSRKNLRKTVTGTAALMVLLTLAGHASAQPAYPYEDRVDYSAQRYKNEHFAQKEDFAGHVPLPTVKQESFLPADKKRVPRTQVQRKPTSLPRIQNGGSVRKTVNLHPSDFKKPKVAAKRGVKERYQIAVPPPPKIGK